MSEVGSSPSADSPPPFAGRAGVVTGGASGIGRACVLQLVQAGARVVIGDLNADGARETIELAGGENWATFVRCDIASLSDAEKLVSTCVDRFGGLHFAHNNAGIEFPGVMLADIDPPDWQRMIDVNLTGAWNCMRAELPVMVRGGGGTIVNTASGLGFAALAGHAPYVAAKAGLIGLTKSAAVEYGPFGVRVNCLCPGIANTAMWMQVREEQPEIAEAARSRNPMRRFAEPSEMASAAVWLLSDASSYVNGHPLVVDGGLMASR